MRHPLIFLVFINLVVVVSLGKRVETRSGGLTHEDSPAMVAALDYADYEGKVSTPPSDDVDSLKLSLEDEARDEIHRLIGDLHRDEIQSQRTTVTREDMTTIGFSEEMEGSGGFAPTYTTLIQEIESIPPTASPDLFDYLDYDSEKVMKWNANKKKERKKKKKIGLVGGAEAVIKNGRILKYNRIGSKKKKVGGNKLKSRKFRKLVNKSRNRMRVTKILTNDTMKLRDPRKRFIVGSTTSVLMGMRRAGREKRDVEDEDLMSSLSVISAGGSWDEFASDATRVEPSLVVNESNQIPVTPKLVTLKSSKKVVKKIGNEYSEPYARKPSSLETLINEFVEQLPPIARHPSPPLIDQLWT